MRSPNCGAWECPGDRMSVRGGLGALYGNPPIPSLVSFCHFELVWGRGSLLFLFCIYINSDVRKRDQLHGWNSSLVWVLPEVEPSVGGET